MTKKEQVKLVQDYVNLLGKTYIIMLSSLEEFFGAPLSTNEKVVLQILDEEPISIKEISLRTGLALSTLTNVIDKMEDKRLVRRRQSRTDRRMVKIELEFAGRTIKKRFNRLIRQLSTTFLVILSEADRANFTSAMGKIARILSESSDQVPDVFGSLEEPFRLVLSKQFRKK